MTGPAKKKLLVAGAVAALLLYLYLRRKPKTDGGRIELLVEDAYGGAAASAGYFEALDPSDPSVTLDDFGNPLITRPSQL